MSLEAIAEKHILIAADATESGERAVLYVANMLGGLQGFRITVLHVIAVPDADFFVDPTQEQAWTEAETLKGTKVAARYKTLLMQAGFEDEKVSVEVMTKRCGSLAECILEEQGRLGACTVAIGRRGLTSKEEFLLGSTSNRLMHQARNCAIWVVE